MITSKQYDELCALLGNYRDAVDALHTAAPEGKVAAAYDFAEADKEVHEFALSLVDFDGIAKEAAEQGGWVKWGGGVCPFITDQLIETKWSDGTVLQQMASEPDWEHHECLINIVAYRVVSE